MKIIEIQKFFEIILQKITQQGQDGYLSVNYLEMVPLFIRSIQDMKQELNEQADFVENEE